MNVLLWQGVLVDFCVKIRVVSISESTWVIESRKWACLIVRARSPGHCTCAVNRWVSDGHVYFFHKAQPLAQSESDSGLEACSRLGGGGDRVRVEEGAGGGDD